MNYINILLAKINHFNSKMANSNYSDNRSLYHSNYLGTKYHIRFSPSRNKQPTVDEILVLMYHFDDMESCGTHYKC